MRRKNLIITGKGLNVTNSVEAVVNNTPLQLSQTALKNSARSRRLVESWIKRDEVIYGITTGFGEFKDIKISGKELELLQRNLILSHSAGTGKFVPEYIARLMLLFRINSLSLGYSGVRTELLERLVFLFNEGVVPLIPSQGSVGSSGDLSPLSHMALTLIGEGSCRFRGEIMSSSEVHLILGIDPFRLSAKEGLALINGTQMMSAYLCKSVYDSIILCKLADIAGSLSLEALKGTSKAFDPKIQKVRPHKGQIRTAENLRRLLKGSRIMLSHKDCGKVQDAYSLRCMPQVHGAVRDTVEYCRNVVETEINSATDNPLIFPETGEHLEGGNFHGEPVALASDFLAIAVSELGNISERRIARLVDGNLSGLPRFLTDKGGLNSGLMIAQYTAASLVSQNKVLCHPGSVDSIPTSANQEDHNSMGSVSALKLYEVVNNVRKIIAIEFLCSCQGIDYHRPLRSGAGSEEAYRIFRKSIPHQGRDEVTSDLILRSAETIYDMKILMAVERKCGGLH